MKRSHVARSIFSAVLCFSLLLSCTSCKKKVDRDKKKRDILETDAFFETEIHELKIPVDESKELETCYVDSMMYLGDKIIASYSIQYKIPDTIMLNEEYYVTGIAMYNVQGDYLGDISLMDDQDRRGGYYQNCVAVDRDGNFAALVSKSDEDIQKCQYKIVFRDSSGARIDELDLETPPRNASWFYQDLQFLPEGRIALRGNMNTPTYVFDDNGKYLFEISSMSRGIISEIFVQDGKYYVFSTPTDFFEEINYYIHEVDIQTGELKQGKPAKISDARALTVVDNGTYMSDSNGVSKYNLATGEMEKVFDWNQTDVNHSMLSSLHCYPVNENEFHALATKTSQSFYNEKYYVMNLKRAEKNPHAGKKIMYVGGLGLDNGFYDYVYAYNADPNRKCRIETTDYFASPEDGTVFDEHFYTNVTSRINLMLLSGDAPDILVNFAGYDQYANDEMLVDLNTFIDGENGFDRKEYFDNIFRSMEVNGKLYYAPTTFSLRGYMTNEDLIRADVNWTFDDLDRAAESLPDGTILIPPTESGDILKMLLGSDLSGYMDYTKKNVSFNSEEIVKIFEEVKKYAAKEDLSDTTFISGMTGSSKYEGIVCYDVSDFNLVAGKKLVKLCDYLKNGSCAMLPVTITNLNEYSFYCGLTDGKGKLVGYPTIHGNGVMAKPEGSMAIVAYSPYKDEAWDVIRNFFSEEAQLALTQETGSDFPLKTSAYEAKIAEEEKLINKQYNLYLKEAERSDFVYTIVYPAEDSQIKDLREIIENIHWSFHTDEAVLSLILEEAPGYFVDNRPAEEVLKNIDNRARQVVTER